MAVAAFVLSVIAVVVALLSAWFTYRADQRGEREDERAGRRETRELEEAAAKRQGSPIVTAGIVHGGERPHLEFTVENAGPATITALWLEVVDASGAEVSSPAGGSMVIAPGGPPVFVGVDVPRERLTGELRVIVRWRDPDGERERDTGIRPSARS